MTLGTPRIADIRAAVCRSYGISQEDMRAGNKSRARRISRGRQVAMYLSKRLTTRSLNQIGSQFGITCHSTVEHASRRIGELRRSDPALDARIKEIVASLERGA